MGRLRKEALLKLAFITHKIADRSGGAERVLIETANEMARRGHKVDIISHENTWARPFYPLTEGVSHKNLFNRPIKRKDKILYNIFSKFRRSLPRSVPVFRFIKWNLYNYGFIHYLKHYLVNENPDVLIPFMPPSIIVSTYAARKSGIPIVASTHNSPYQDFDNPNKWDRNPVDRRKRKEVLSELSRILILLPEYRAWYSEDLTDRIVVMPNAVRLVDKTRLQNASREKRAIFVGRLTEVKRPLFLIEAWRQILADFPGWTLDIFGDGPLQAEVKSAVSHVDPAYAGRINYCGVNSQIENEYLSASLLCHPSEYEGFPLAVTEALSHGLPVIGFSHCSGLNSLVKDGVNGVLVDGNADVTDRWVAKLKMLISTPSMLVNLSKNAPISVSQYQPDLIYDAWERVLSEVVAEIACASGSGGNG